MGGTDVRTFTHVAGVDRPPHGNLVPNWTEDPDSLIPPHSLMLSQRATGPGSHQTSICEGTTSFG